MSRNGQVRTDGAAALFAVAAFLLGLLWLTGGSTPAGAFDDAADFARHDVISSPFPFHGPVWIDVGRSDPFVASDGEFAVAHHLRYRVWPGNHSGSYWGAHMRAYIRFYAQALRSCRR